MSHMTKLDLKIMDEDSLKKALNDLGCEVTNQVTDYYGSTTQSIGGRPVAFGFKHPKASTNRLGFVKNDDGSLQMAGDTYGTGIPIDQFQTQLGGRYALHYSAKMLRRQGFNIVKMPSGLSGKQKLVARKAY